MANDVMKKYVAPPLKEAGFVRKQNTWNRAAGQFVHVVDVQQELSSDAAPQFTLNIGVFFPKAFSICWGKPAPALVKEWNCQLRKRAGAFLSLSDSRLPIDYWWTLHTTDDVPLVGEEVAALIRGRILPYLGTINSLAALRDGLMEYRSLRPWDTLYVIYLAIVTALLNDVAGALEMAA